jgi:hypothetical protein
MLLSLMFFVQCVYICVCVLIKRVATTDVNVLSEDSVPPDMSQRKRNFDIFAKRVCVE